MKVRDKILGVCANFKFFKTKIDKINDKSFVFKYEEGAFKKIGDINLIESSMQINNNRLFFGHLNICLFNERLMVAVESVNGSLPEGPANINEIEIYTF